jgi:4-carboxymuconolactone decarboxylase
LALKQLAFMTLAALSFAGAGDAQPRLEDTQARLDSARVSTFTGRVTVSPRINGTGGSRLNAATVTFERGARTNWHSHSIGQLLIVTQGKGWLHQEGQAVRALSPGDIVWTAPGVKHWHGGTRVSGMTHVAVSETTAGVAVTWLQPVTDAEFNGPE